jgi:intracellular multiplication protein IcmC
LKLRSNKYLLLFISSLLSAQSQSIGENVLSGLAGADEFFIYLYYVVGIGFVFAGINRLKKLGHRTAFMNVDSGITGPLMLVMIGAALTSLPSFFSLINQTLFANSAIENASELAYASSDPDFEAQVRPIIYIVQLVGMVAILRGFLILSKATGQGAQPGTISKGIIHIFGGILAVNIVTTVKVMTNTFGVS